MQKHESRNWRLEQLFAICLESVKATDRPAKNSVSAGLVGKEATCTAYHNTPKHALDSENKLSASSLVRIESIMTVEVDSF